MNKDNVSWLSLCNYCICNKIQQKISYFTTHALIFSCCSSSPSTSILMDTIPQIFLVGFNYPLFCIPWLKAVLTGTNYDGTLCIIKKYKSTSEECHHWISIHFPSISHPSKKMTLKIFNGGDNHTSGFYVVAFTILEYFRDHLRIH